MEDMAQTAATSLVDRIRSVRKRGVLLTLRVWTDKAALRLLARYFGFNPWHADAPISARPYRLTVAKLVNEVGPSTVVEVGCGLGSILSLVTAPVRIGYDVDPGVIRAANFLRGRNIIFRLGGLDTVKEVQVDVLVLVNWIHEVSPSDLARQLDSLLPRTSYLVLDAIDPGTSSDYKYKHSFDFLRDRANLIARERIEGEERSFLLYKVLR